MKLLMGRVFAVYFINVLDYAQDQESRCLAAPIPKAMNKQLWLFLT
jgi:hypothetical protein